MRANIARLEQLGVRLSVDEADAGNSTLDRVGAFPVSTLKIDRSFVQVLGPRDESAALVSALMSMARDLGVECVAEGVETSHQSRILLQRGCTTAQGFFFSPPLLANDIERLFGSEVVDQDLSSSPGTPFALAPHSPGHDSLA